MSQSCTKDKSFTGLAELFDISHEKALEILKNFKSEFASGLTGEKSAFKCLPTYINKIPTGGEKGSFIVADLGGSNLRVGLVELLGDGKRNFHRTKWALTDNERNGSAKDLFHFIGSRIQEYLQAQEDEKLKAAAKGEAVVEIGFTFSYPVAQSSLRDGVLVQWNKGITNADAIGKDVSSMLQEAFDRIGMHKARVEALVNDTVGTLVAHCYKDPRTRLGVILGTGTNAAVFVPREAIPKLPSNMHFRHMAINIEWGAFGEGHLNYLPMTPFDTALDELSPNPGKQPYEKMVSGMYLGELVRLVLEQKNINIPKSPAPFSFETRYLSEIATTVEKKDNLSLYLNQNLSIDSQEFDQDGFAKLCHSVMKRSATLCAIGIAAITSHLFDPINEEIVVALDGSIYDNYPGYPGLMDTTLAYLIPSNKIKVTLAKSESLIGAAVALAISSTP